MHATHRVRHRFDDFMQPEATQTMALDFDKRGHARTAREECRELRQCENRVSKKSIAEAPRMMSVEPFDLANIEVHQRTVHP